jgi:hypothetical protein
MKGGTIRSPVIQELPEEFTIDVPDIAFLYVVVQPCK